MAMAADPSSSAIDRIRSLLAERNGILLAHNYEPPEIQDMADLCGDSLELSIRAAETDAAVIVFCGVHFMAETASILSPDKTVLLPVPDAGCPMADMITPEALAERQAELGPMPTVTYVNSPAAVKARSTVCCTSANAVSVVNALDAPEVLMGPDRNLALYTARHTEKTVRIWEGYCPVHDRLTAQAVRRARAAHPEAVFMAHPECRPEVIDLADAVLSTSGMIRYAGTVTAREFLVGTESGILHPLKKAHPDRIFHPVSEEMVCPDMKKITPADVIRSLTEMTGEVRVPPEVREPALAAVRRMIEIGS